MKFSALSLSVVLHFCLLMLSLFGALFLPRIELEIPISQVEVIDNASFDALIAQAQLNAEGEEGAQTLAEIPSAQPSENADSPQEEQQVDAPNPPADDQAALAAPDEVQPLTQANQVENTGLAAKDSQGLEQAVETTDIAPPAPRDAAEIRDLAEAAETPKPNETAQEASAEQLEEEAPPEQDAVVADSNAISEIRPNADENAALSSAPALSVVPPARPSNLAPSEQNALALSDAPETQSPQEAPQIEASETIETAENSDLDNLFQSLEDGAIEESETSTSQASTGRGLSPIEISAVYQKIERAWNKTTLIPKANYERLVTTVEFQTNKNGELVGGVKLLSPSAPDADFLVAFESVERAINAAMPLNLPEDIDPNGVIWRLQFDPVGGVGLN